MLHVCSHSMLPAVLKSQFKIKVKVTKSIQSQCTLLSILCFNHSLHQLGVSDLSQNILSGVNCDYYFCCFIFSLISNFKIFDQHQVVMQHNLDDPDLFLFNCLNCLQSGTELVIDLLLYVVCFILDLLCLEYQEEVELTYKLCSTKSCPYEREII